MQVDFAAAANHVEQLQSHRPGKALVDQFERRHPPAEDAVHLVEHRSLRFARRFEHIFTEILVWRIVALRLYSFTHCGLAQRKVCEVPISIMPSLGLTA